MTTRTWGKVIPKELKRWSSLTVLWVLFRTSCSSPLCGQLKLFKIVPYDFVKWKQLSSATHALLVLIFPSQLLITSLILLVLTACRRHFLPCDSRANQAIAWGMSGRALFNRQHLAQARQSNPSPSLKGWDFFVITALAFDLFSFRMGKGRQ
jgi:hypothetical protein